MAENENRTRQELCAAPRELLEQKPLDQLRVRELTDRCRLRRQTYGRLFTIILKISMICLPGLWSRSGSC